MTPELLCPTCHRPWSEGDAIEAEVERIREWAATHNRRTHPMDSLSLADASTYLGVAPQSLRNAAPRYQLPLRKINGRTRVLISDLAAHLYRQVDNY